ncbi:MAG: hypothetical protein ACLT0Y_03485 [Christensenellales bacterium]
MAAFCVLYLIMDKKRRRGQCQSIGLYHRAGQNARHDAQPRFAGLTGQNIV